MIDDGYRVGAVGYFCQHYLCWLLVLVACAGCLCRLLGVAPILVYNSGGSDFRWSQLFTAGIERRLFLAADFRGDYFVRLLFLAEALHSGDSGSGRVCLAYINMLLIIFYFTLN